ncbi:unnamed protein product [Rangifer tarandus platyrhynchus]|uniref:Uncharacterized protein n=2 Tax=Rangifer tarandus platyrhynchus TaxID=3082113 RepID=A0ACB0E1J7_RANTA|nr:unnamed protein product [Rangifer tarandus platyrhynchus]CAI9694233.1 unnamed protein product [Rangifer tarandus platyrhynchus]
MVKLFTSSSALQSFRYPAPNVIQKHSRHSRPYGEERRSTENTRRGAALRFRVGIRPGSRPTPRCGRAPGRARRASPHGWPEIRAPGAPVAAAQSPPQNKSARRRTRSPRPRALGLPAPPPSREPDETCECQREPSPPLTYQSRTQPERAGKTQLLSAPEFKSTRLRPQGRVEVEAHSRKANPAPAQRQERDPGVPGTGVLVPLG